MKLLEETIQERLDKCRGEIIEEIFNKSPSSLALRLIINNDHIEVLIRYEKYTQKSFEVTEFRKEFPNLYERFLKGKERDRLSLHKLNGSKSKEV